jgi:hypothetical protein
MRSETTDEARISACRGALGSEISPGTGYGDVNDVNTGWRWIDEGRIMSSGGALDMHR